MLYFNVISSLLFGGWLGFLGCSQGRKEGIAEVLGTQA